MEADLKSLEFEGIRRLLEKLCATPFGADAARNLAPAPDLGSARRLRDAITVARLGLESGTGPVLPDLPDIRAALRQAAPSGVALSGTALRNLWKVLLAGKELKPHVEAHPALLPQGPEMLDGTGDLAGRIDGLLLLNGAVREDGSALLEQLHAEMKRERESVQQEIQAQLRRMAGARMYWTGQRLCIHLGDDRQENLRGVRRGTGPGGHGILIEPMELVGRNNQLEKLAGRVEQENQRTLRALTDTVRERLPALQKLVDALTWMDLAIAGAQLSIHLQGRAAELVEEPMLHLEEAFHPQLWLAFSGQGGLKPKPLTVHLDAQYPILVVTGPNAGGKSVSLKTVGLLVVMAHCGLHVPVSGRAVIGRFTRIFVDMGDPQSLAFALSTFSGHVQVLKRLLGEADGHSLILLDEMGTGTDPEEGAALAMAVLDDLASRGARGMATTHLTPIKSFAAGHPHLRNASMRFDYQNLEPTYELQMDVAGQSLGLVIAEKGGLPSALVEKARGYLAGLQRGP